MTSSTDLPPVQALTGGRLATTAELIARLEEFRERRGYVNPQQGPMAAALPGVFDGYRVFYKALVLDEKHLSPLEKEFVWLVLLCVASELGTHHLKLFFDHGGTDSQALAAFRLAAWVKGTDAYTFVDENWQPYFPRLSSRQAYLDGVNSLIAGFDDVTSTWAHLALLSAQSGAKSKWGVAAELHACYELGIPEASMAEAMSVALWPCGANAFHDAAGVWLEMVRSGQVNASQQFKAWAAMPSQDGLDLKIQSKESS
ncbi:hypothetical protein W822_19565 [Advenella kashmirensis W13003]|uniref:Carboxymuconolactone decarboxylase-like domain-containing protein n=1 Tax=Advenella kashmirensis W13003 TaxID=1424334 RepID=V8QPJ3_9BURK|nr:hypothetical protein [Advenella kashmirensis]ETF00919.1 hypothetical protein W822_19565 [Advenella kashmirensis W13003]